MIAITSAPRLYFASSEASGRFTLMTISASLTASALTSAPTAVNSESGRPDLIPAPGSMAISPDTVKKFKALGVDVAIEPGAGLKSGLPDSEYTAVGATISADAVKDADIVIKVKRPEASELAGYKRGALVIAIMDP